MSDLVKRLREGRTDGSDLRWTVTDIHVEAAAEIERLRNTGNAVIEVYAKMEDGDGNPCPQIAALRAALNPESAK